LLSSSSQASQYPQACNSPGAAITLTGKTCGTFIPPQMSCRLPADIEGKLRQVNFNNRQRATDLFAWQSFIALNWPAETGERGIPAPSKPMVGASPRVWETWKETDEIFRPGGTEPAPWNSPFPPLPQGCAGESGAKTLYRQMKVADVLDGDIQPTLAAKIISGHIAGSLASQNGELVRYEIRYNQKAFDYVVENNLYSSSHQAVSGETTFPPGSTIIKASWLPLSSKDEALKYKSHTVSACICDPPVQGESELKGCKNQEAALVGFHIMKKTQSAPQWIWSTFEQVNNIKSSGPTPASFNNPNCNDPDVCTDNIQLAPGISNQVTRVIKIPNTPPDCAAGRKSVDNIARLNEDIQLALRTASSPFSNYQLVAAQWPVTGKNDEDLPPTVFKVIPQFLGNTTMETFIQPTSSCMGCHAMARTNRVDQFVSADFSFTLNNSLPVLHDPLIMPNPADQSSDQQLARGYQLATCSLNQVNRIGC